MQPSNNNGSIIIRFSLFSYSYKLSKLGSFYEKQAYAESIRICLAIENDIKLGRFTCKDNNELFTAYHPLAKLSSHHELNSHAVDAISMIETFLGKKEFKDRVLTPVLALLRSYGKPVKTNGDAVKFWGWISNDGKRSNNSNNLYLATLKPVCPMFIGIKPLKASKVQKDEKPFTKDEIKSIIQVFDQNFPLYSSFIRFLFSTGCRPNEATALTWNDVDFEAKTISIRKAVSIAKDGSKAVKDTKTGVIRVIPMNDAMYKVLSNHKAVLEFNFHLPHTIPDWLVFTLSGSYIDLGNFRARVWVKALKLANVPYRTIYNTRHTFCSHFLNETPDFIKLASITHGTKSGVQTLIKHYAHLVEKVTMPDMF